MYRKIKNININYKQVGDGEDVVLLHGWGQNIEMMSPLGNLLKEKYRVTMVDLPGFGMSDAPDFAYNVYDYVSLLEDLFKELKIKNPIMIGHSFGGRLSIIYASRNETKKMVLFGSPCVRHNYKSIKQTVLKSLKKVKMLAPLAEVIKRFVGSTDYKNAKGVMREVLVKTINEDLTDCAIKVKCPTLLIWGDKDEAVPVSDAQELEKLLIDGALIVLPGTHYCYLENLSQVNSILDNFL